MNLSILELGGPTMTVRRRDAFCLTPCDLPNIRPLPSLGTLSVAFSDTLIVKHAKPGLHATNSGIQLVLCSLWRS